MAPSSVTHVKTTNGKRKKIEKTNHHDKNKRRRTAFFKLQLTKLYKAITEFANQTRSQVGFLVFSPSGEEHTFGIPSFAKVANRYLDLNHPIDHPMTTEAEIDELERANNEFIKQIEADKRIEKALEAELAGEPLDDWWNRSMEDASEEEVAELELAYKGLCFKLLDRMREMRNDQTAMN